MTYQEYREIFRQDENGRYENLIIPKSEVEKELNLIGKSPSEVTIDEIIRIKKYAAEVFRCVDQSTIK